MEDRRAAGANGGEETGVRGGQRVCSCDGKREIHLGSLLNFAAP